MAIVATWIDDEAADEQATESVDVLERKARPPPQRFSSGHGHPEAHDHRQKHVGGNAGRPGRVPVERARGQVHATAPLPTLAHQLSFSCTSPSCGTKRPGRPMLVEPLGPVVAEKEGGFRGHVGHETASHPQTVTSSQPDVLGNPLRGSIRWCCSFAAPEPTPSCSSAGGQTSGVESHRPATRQGDVHLALRGEVATGRDEAVSPEQCESVIDRHGLDDAVQVELHPAPEHEHAAQERNSARPCRRRGARRPRIGGKLGKVAVVAGGFDRRAQRWVDEPYGHIPRPERCLDRASERRRDERPSAGTVDTPQLAFLAKSAERRVALFEQPGNELPVLLRSRRLPRPRSPSSEPTRSCSRRRGDHGRVGLSRARALPTEAGSRARSGRTAAAARVILTFLEWPGYVIRAKAAEATNASAAAPASAIFASNCSPPRCVQSRLRMTSRFEYGGGFLTEA